MDQAAVQGYFDLYNNVPLLLDGPAVHFFSSDPAEYLFKNFPEQFEEGVNPDEIPIIDAQFIGEGESLFMCLLQDRKNGGKYHYTCYDSMNTEDLSDESTIRFKSKDPQAYFAKNYPEKFGKWSDSDDIPIVDAQFIGAQGNDSICFPKNCNANEKCQYTCHEMKETNFKVLSLSDSLNGAAQIVVSNSLTEIEEQLLEETRQERIMEEERLQKAKEQRQREESQRQRLKQSYRHVEGHYSHGISNQNQESVWNLQTIVIGTGAFVVFGAGVYAGYYYLPWLISVAFEAPKYSMWAIL